MINRPIAEKECWALYNLIKAVVSKDTDFTFLIDNKAALGAFTKGRSKNLFINGLVSEVRQILFDNNSRANFIWISTRSMGPLADQPSRSEYARDEFGLTDAGVDRLFSLRPSIRYRRQNQDLISLFGSPKNNPLQVPYFSVDFDLDDNLCRKQEAFHAIETRLANSGRFGGGVFCFPPPLLSIELVHQIVRGGLERDTEIFILVPSSQVLTIKNLLLGVGRIEVVNFCGSRNSIFLECRFLHKGMMSC